MALIVEYHVIADMYPVAMTANIKAGMVLAFNANGNVEACGADGLAIGIAGDTIGDGTFQNEAYSASLHIGSKGANTRYTQNRISDNYNEALASGKMTVYHGGGKFWTDQFTANPTNADYAAGVQLKAVAGGLVDSKDAGTTVVGIATGAAQQYPSGVPGVDTTDGSIALGSGTTFTDSNGATTANAWLPFILRLA